MASLVPYEPGLDYGFGYDRITSKIRGEGVIRTVPEAVVGAAGASTIEFRLSQVESHEQLAAILNVSASGSLGNALTGGGSLQASFVNEHSVSQFSIVLMVHVMVVNSHQKMHGVRLNSDGIESLDKQGPDSFRVTYGDQFVIGTTSGGELVGLINYTAKSETERTQIQASVKAGGGLGSWEASADFNNEMQKINSTASYEIYILQIGGADKSMPTTIEGLIKKATAFPEEVAKASAPFTVELQEYSALPLPAGKSPIDAQTQRDQLVLMAQFRSRVLDQIATLAFIQSNPTFFDFADVSKARVDEQAATVTATLNKIHKSASECFHDYHVCSCPTDLQMITLELPTLKGMTEEEAAEAKARFEKKQEEDAKAVDQLLGKKNMDGILIKKEEARNEIKGVLHGRFGI